MNVRYRANGEVRELTDDAARLLIDAGVCEAVEETPVKPKKVK